MNKPLLSIVVPSINPSCWEHLYHSANTAITKYPFEIIFVGPYGLPQCFESVANVKYVKDFGSPSRAMQIGTLLSEGQLLMWMVDDGSFEPGVMDNCINTLLQHDRHTIINLIHSEGDDYKTGKDERLNRQPTDEDSWFKAVHHDDLKSAVGIQDDWYVFPLFLMHAEYYYRLGGINCNYEHTNFNLCDMFFRAQLDGCALIHGDPEHPFARLTHDANRPANTPVVACHFSDRQKLLQSYQSAEQVKQTPVSIDINNWKQSESHWSRRWSFNEG